LAVKIWCLFSWENDYNQPPSNLVAWWAHKPTLRQLGEAVGGRIPIKVVAAVLEGENRRYCNVDYRLEEIEEGKVS
jgi:hypothetical protein